MMAYACQMRNQWTKFCAGLRVRDCSAPHRFAIQQRFVDSRWGYIDGLVKNANPEVKWKADCVKSIMTNPRYPGVMDQIQGYNDKRPTIPLYDINTKKCKKPELDSGGFAIDECLFGKMLDELDEDLEENSDAAIEDTKFCDHVDEMVKCANSENSKCYSKKAGKKVSELYMGVIAYAATHR